LVVTASLAPPRPHDCHVRASDVQVGFEQALRSLIGTVPVFENAGKLCGRIGVNPMPLYRRNPSTFGVMVAGCRYELYSNYALQIQAVTASVTRPA
jgi:hypothetical protein